MIDKEVATLKNMWALYEQEMLPPSCSEVQWTETRKAFVGAVGAMLALLDELAKEETPEALGIEILAGLNGELQAYFMDERAAGQPLQ